MLPTMMMTSQLRSWPIGPSSFRGSHHCGSWHRLDRSTDSRCHPGHRLIDGAAEARARRSHAWLIGGRCGGLPHAVQGAWELHQAPVQTAEPVLRQQRRRGREPRPCGDGPPREDLPNRPRARGLRIPAWELPAAGPAVPVLQRQGERLRERPDQGRQTAAVEQPLAPEAVPVPAQAARARKMSSGRSGGSGGCLVRNGCCTRRGRGHAQHRPLELRGHRDCWLLRLGSRRRCTRNVRRRIHHQHGAFELWSCCALQVEAALAAGRGGIRILRPAIRTKHTSPPGAAGLAAQQGKLEPTRARFRFSRPQSRFRSRALTAGRSELSPRASVCRVTGGRT